MSNPIEVSDNSFKEDVLQSELPVIVDFWAPWCGPCRQVSPVLDQLADDYTGKVTVAKVNVDDNPNTAASYGITSIPAVYLFKDGHPVKSVVGARPKEFFEKEFKTHIEG